MRTTILTVLLVAVSQLSVGQPAAPPVAQRFFKMFEDLRQSQVQPGRHVSVAMHEREINEYLQFSLKATPRPGVESVNIKVFPNNYISTFTLVDFDAIERWKPGTIPAVMRPVLHGKQTVWVDYRFGTGPDGLKFEVEKAYYDKLRLPGFLVEKMISIVASRQPEHYDTSKPLPIPFGLKSVWTEGQTLKAVN